MEVNSPVTVLTEALKIFLNFQNCARCEKDLKDDKHSSVASILRYNMVGYLSLDIICYSKLAVFFELRPLKTVRFPEHIMPADKYPSNFADRSENFRKYSSVLS